MATKTNPGLIARIGYSQLPPWARPAHPIMRSIMGSRSATLKRRLLKFLLFLAAMAVAVGLGYIIANNQTANETPTTREILYWPLVGGQIIAMLLAVALTANVVAIERQKQTWDSLKLSLSGVSLTLRARWISVFFKLGWLLAAITIGRIVYTGLLLRDMTEFQGRALDLYISGITPEISLNVAMLLMAAIMTAFILLPFIAVGLGAAIGLLMSVYTQTRSIVILGMLLLIGLRLAITAGAIVVGNTVFEEVGVVSELFQMDNSTAWYRIIFASVEGDMMLKLVNLETLGQIWADVENTVYIGGVILGVVLVQAILANAIVLFAAWRATKPTKA